MEWTGRSRLPPLPAGELRHLGGTAPDRVEPQDYGLHLRAGARRPEARRISYWIYRPTLGWELIERVADAAEIAAHARTPLLESADPLLVPLETLLGRDDAEFPPGEEPPWRGQVESSWGR